tara:strand:- start:83 stop:1033 length:951 start_codon:yes stop_codon:yes gene_type:complete
LKEDEVIKLSKQCNFNANQALPLKLEASGREYWRVINDNDSLVLCYLDPSKGDHSDFIKITNSLKENNVNSVDIFHHNADLGVTLQQDLGDNDLLSILSKDNKSELLEGSLDLLIKIQNSNIEDVDRFSENELEQQMNLFKDVFCLEFLNINADKSIDDLISITIDHLSKQPWVNCHFDFERRNLILSKDLIRVIDYQDMKIGPIGIDLSGILIDHYYEVNFENIYDLLGYFSEKVGLKYSKEELFEFLRWGCIQRNMRILGTLANLYIKHKRSFRLKDLPMVLLNLISMIPENHASKEFILKETESLLNDRISKL